eukprot:UN07997
MATYDPLGKQLEIIESIAIGIVPVYIAHIISSYIGYIESTLGCEIAAHVITSPPRPSRNEICLHIAPPKSSKCKYILESITIRLGYFTSWDFDRWPGDGMFNAKLELMDSNETHQSTEEILFENLNITGGGRDNQFIKCETNLQLKCGETYLFYIEQTTKQIEQCQVAALLCKNSEENKSIIGQRCFVKDVVATTKNNESNYSVGRKWSHTKLTELVFYHN